MSSASGANHGMGKSVPMARKLAYRNLFHDRVSLLVTLVGIVFSVVLIAVQCSIYLGSEFRIVAVMDHIKADLWVLPGGTKSFDLPVLLPGRVVPVHRRERTDPEDRIHGEHRLVTGHVLVPLPAGEERGYRGGALGRHRPGRDRQQGRDQHQRPAVPEPGMG